MIDILIYLVIALAVIFIAALAVKFIGRQCSVPPEIIQIILIVLGVVALIVLLIEVPGILRHARGP